MAQSSKDIQRIEFRKNLANSVWNGKIDQMNTREIADLFKVSVAVARYELQSLCRGRLDERFTSVPNEEESVFIKDGNKFSWSQNADELEGHGRAHHVWFCY